MRALMWFRADLRVNDNTALSRACAESDDGVVAVFCVCPGQWASHDWGDVRAEFVLRNLESLKERLGTLRIPLRVVETDDFGGVPEKLVALAEETGCDRLYFNREYEWNERERDESVVDAFEGAGLHTLAFHDQVLFEPGEIRTKGDGSYYTVFTSFKKACWGRYNDDVKGSGRWDVLDAPKKVSDCGVKGDDAPSSVKGFGDSGVDESLWPAGERAGMNRLRAFVKHRIDEYDEARDFPARDETSRVSAYLNSGVLSVRQCMAAALEANNGRIGSGRQGMVTWMEELLWREFYRHVLVGFPRVSRARNFRTEYDKIEWRRSEQDLEAWKSGETGYPIVDAAMRCLRETGWMHNRLRMIVAMFLTKHLLIDWREGEAHFMRHLVDGDLASNNGGWQWSASTGTDAQPYFRIFNPTTQSERFDPDGAFIREWVPELAGVEGKAVHAPHERWDGELDYPRPIVEHKAARERALEAFKRVKK